MNFVSSISTFLWILIEAIQFGYMAYLIWKERNSGAYRNIQRARSAFASA